MKRNIWLAVMFFKAVACFIPSFSFSHQDLSTALRKNRLVKGATKK